MTNASNRLDVSKLPSEAMDHRSPIWWGNALLLCIETSMFALVIASYFYFRRNFEHWPPPKVNSIPPVYQPLPFLTLATTNVIVMLISIIPMAIADRACLRMNESLVRAMGVLTVTLGLAIMVMRYREFYSLRFRWDENVYGSITWTILGLHFMHLMILWVEDALMTAWVFVKGLDDKHARDIRVTAVYWYWVVAMGVICYTVVYWYPRWVN